MQLTSIERIDTISPATFRNEYLSRQKPVIIRNMSHDWAAYHKWNWDYFKGLVGNICVDVYRNRDGSQATGQRPDGHMLFGDYLEMIQEGPVDISISPVNLFRYTPHISKDFTLPFVIKGFLQRSPILSVGGAGTVSHMHYDSELAHTFHTAFEGRKKVLLLDNSQSTYLYKMPSTVESAADFTKGQHGVDTGSFPALNYARGYECILEHGDTLFIPSGFWQHMEYLESGFSLSIRALPEGILPKVNSLYHLLAKNTFNSALNKLAPEWWHQFKHKYAREKAHEAIGKQHPHAMA